jgi:hypothetical protein
MDGKLKALALAAAIGAVPALAHEGADRARGTVESVTAERIVIRAEDGHSVAFAVRPDTRFFRGDNPARRDDVQVGERAVVHGKKAGEEVHAVRVKLGPAPPSR